MKIRKVDSKDNPLIRTARRVRDGGEPGHIFVEGIRLAAEAIRAGVPVETCLVTSGFGSTASQTETLALADNYAKEIVELGSHAFSSVADTKTSQGIILLCRRPESDRSSFESAISSERKGQIPIIVLLNEINNPANLGAVVRTAEAAGALGIITTAGSADVFSPKGLRGAMGSAFRVPIWTNAAWAEVVHWARSKRFELIGATPDGGSTHFDLNWVRPAILVLGSEAHGIEEGRIADLDKTISIPMSESVESLNLAVAAGIILFEARRQADTQA